MRREGGYVNHAADRGGPTKYGIRQATLAAWRGRAVTAAEVAALTETEARAIYRNEYIEKPGYAAITDPHLLAQVVDTAVNHGPHRATAMLQRALGVTQDGAIGPETRAALQASSSRELCKSFLALRVRAYAAILRTNTSQRVFAAGWLSRVAEMIQVLP